MHLPLLPILGKLLLEGQASGFRRSYSFPIPNRRGTLSELGVDFAPNLMRNSVWNLPRLLFAKCALTNAGLYY